MISSLVALFCAAAMAQTAPTPVSAEKALADLTAQGLRIQTEPIRRAAVSQNGRVKALDTLAREAVLYLTGSYSRFGLKSTQLYFALASTLSAPYAQVAEVRNTNLRQRLGYMKDKRFFSLAELESSNLGELAEPMIKKQEEGGKLSGDEKSITEAYNQMGLLQQLITGDHFIHSIDFSFINSSHGQSGTGEVTNKARQYLDQLRQNAEAAGIVAQELVAQSKTQQTPEMFQHYIEKIDTEIFYNDARPFFFASLLSLLIGLVFLLDITRKKLNRAWGVGLFLLAMAPLVLGIGLRVYITKFAPVTNMFGTMLWVAFGVLLFSLLLFYLYENYIVCGLLMTGTGLLLMLTEQIPLILSPDLDPLVAVLRSNFWLSTHVTTITISYAAYTIAMILGNAALVRMWFPGDHREFIREYSHYAYRMIQLGCFLLSIGIILGGIWADYSWGRFWGWDPKETWALIADMGFLVLLHARFVGWVSPFLLLALSPVAYLLVIMAWYGVNFILAAGLHSYGFSSGGTLAVVSFVGVQTLFIALTTAKMLSKKSATR